METTPIPEIITSSDWQSVIDALTSQINIGTVLAVIATSIAIGFPLVIGINKGLEKIKDKFKFLKL